MPSNSEIIDLSSPSPPAPSRAAPRVAQASTKSVPKSSYQLPKGNVLVGKTLRFAGVWMTMTIEQARDLCKANGGQVVDRGSPHTNYLVVGSRGSPDHNVCVALAPNAKIITERQFLNMILPPEPRTEKENVPSAAGKKRPSDASDAGPSKPAKAPRKSSPPPKLAAPKFKRVHDFLGDGSVELHGKTLKAFDCGGEVFRAQRGKSVMDLLEKFEEFLDDCDGDYHSCL